MLLKGLAAALVFFSLNHAEAVTSSPSLRDGGPRFLVRALGSACYSMDSLRRGLPCNPAFVAKEKSPQFDMDLLLGSNLDYIRDAESLLGGRADERTVVRVFSHRDLVEAEISLEASYQRPTWGLSVEPYRIIYVSQFHNSALPMIDMIAAEEQSVKAQLASFTAGNFYVGLQLRYTHVRYLGSYFSLVEALAGGGSDFFSIRKQDLFYVEPGILYAWEESTWEPQISAMLSQWGLTSEKSEQYPIQPRGLLGVSIKPPVPLGSLELGVQFQAQNEMKNLRESFRGGVVYQLGVLQTVFSASDNDYVAAFLATYRSFVTGLSYWGQNDGRTLFVQFGMLL